MRKSNTFLFRKFKWMLWLSLLVQFGFGQQVPSKLDSLQQAFASFEYKKVVQLADQLLRQQNGLTLQQRLEILREKAIAHYILDQNQMATLTFIQILKLKPDYELDSLRNSPKIIRFFQTVKKNFLKDRIRAKHEPSTLKPKASMKMPAQSVGPNALYRSLIWPGWGHCQVGQKKKGHFLMMASFVGASASAYFIWQTQLWEQRYLNAVVQTDIDGNYREYNKNYRLRNEFLIAFGIIWFYAQYDLSKYLFQTQEVQVHVVPTFGSKHVAAISFSIRF